MGCAQHVGEMDDLANTRCGAPTAPTVADASHGFWVSVWFCTGLWNCKPSNLSLAWQENISQEKVSGSGGHYSDLNLCPFAFGHQKGAA